MSTTHTAVFENAILKSTELKADTKIAVGLDTEQTTKELTVVGDTPEIRIQDKTGSNPEVNQTTLSIVADGGVTHFRAGTSTFDTTETKGDIKFQSSTGDSTHAIITGTGRVGVGTMAPTESLDIVGNINLQKVSNTATIKLDSNVVTEFTRSKKLIKYPRVAMTGATTAGYTASASSENNGTTTGQAWRAFDGVAGGERGYHSTDNIYTSGIYGGTASMTDVNNTVYDGEWIKLQLPTGERIKVMGAYFYPRDVSWYKIPYKGYILGSNTGANGSWNLISTFNSVTTSASYVHPGVHMFENNTNEYYNHIALVANEVYPTSLATALNFAELEYFVIPEYDPDAHGTDFIARSIPNTPNTDWLEFYYDAKDLSDGSISSVTDLKPSGTTVNGTVNGSVSVSNGAFTFNGTTDYIRGTLNSVLSDYTFSLWINASEQVQTGFVGIFEMGTRTTNNSTGLYLNGSGKIVHLAFANNLESSHKVQRGWLHIICAYSEGDRTIYVNGEMIAFDNYGLLTPSGTQFTIGANNGGGINSGESVGQFFTGSIANLRLFNRILSGTEIQELYSYQKEYFGASPNVLTFKNGCLGVGTNEPKATLDVAGTFQCGNSPLKFYHIQGQHVSSAGNHSIPRPADMSDVVISITGVTYNSNEDAVPFERHADSASWETDVFYDVSATAFVINNQGSAVLGKPFSLFVVTL